MPNKGLSFSLQSIFGINQPTANKICAMVGVRPNVPLHYLPASRLYKLSKICRDHISTNLSRQTKENIKYLIDLKHYKGVRHMFGLPARGQRTRTNASTVKRLSVVKHLNTKGSKTRSSSIKKTKTT